MLWNNPSLVIFMIFANGLINIFTKKPHHKNPIRNYHPSPVVRLVTSFETRDFKHAVRQGVLGIFKWLKFDLVFSPAFKNRQELRQRIKTKAESKNVKKRWSNTEE